MYARGGKMLGGNSAFAHIGTYEKIGDEIAIEIKTVRHNPDPNYRAMAGTDDATLLARGRPAGDLYRFDGRLKELPGAGFSSVMTPIEEEAIPMAGGDRYRLFLDRRHRSEEHTSELQSHLNIVCRLLLEKKNMISS